MTQTYQSVLFERLYHAALVGDANAVADLLEQNEFPQKVRELAHELAVTGLHDVAAGVIKPISS